MFLRSIVLLVTLSICRGQKDSAEITTDSSGSLVVRVPQGAKFRVQEVSPTGEDAGPATDLVTATDIEGLRGEFIEQAAKQEASMEEMTTKLENMKESLQGEVDELFSLLASLEFKQDGLNSTQIAQAKCHQKGLLYSSASKDCIYPVQINCADFIEQDGRPLVHCGGEHSYGDTCVSTCSDGFQGSSVTYTCDLDGQWKAPKGNDLKCDDVDECKTGANECQQKCENAVGTFMCACNGGYALNDDLKTCQQIPSETVSYIFQDGDNHPYVVPAGVTEILVDAMGSGGQTTYWSGGKGARVQATLPVTPGETLTVAVGGPGVGEGLPDNRQVTNNYKHAAGGGLVAIFKGPKVTGSVVLLVAGSGGGGGSNVGRYGGDGGKNGLVGTSTNDAAVAGCMGLGGTSSTGGKGGGKPNAGVFGGDGHYLMGGTAGSYGAQGGAGYYGGGGGGHCPNVCGCGGGGGSSYVVKTAKNVKITDSGGSAGGFPGLIRITPIIS
eukprot:m.287700 g.287700  ORF g.287700 m.287700 type:complete len:496 (+) comp16364_c0_seq3:113-1600(+)